MTGAQRKLVERVATRHLKALGGPLSLRPDYGKSQAALPRGEEEAEGTKVRQAGKPEMVIHGRQVQVNKAFADRIRREFPDNILVNTPPGGFTFVHPESDGTSDWDFYFRPDKEPGWYLVSYQPGYLILLQKEGDRMQAHTTRRAFNKYNPDDLLAQLVDILEKYELADVASAVRKLTPQVQQAWRDREKEASTSRVASRFLEATQPSASRVATRVLMGGRSPSHALTSPRRFGLMPVDEFFGEVRERPERQVVTTGDMVQTKDGKVVLFVGTDERGQPILASDEHDLKRKKEVLEQQRLHTGREKSASDPHGREVASVYLHLGNGGATYKVIDAGNGPEFIAAINSFGAMDSEIRIETSPEGLRRIADMLHVAAGDPRLSKHHDLTEVLEARGDDLPSYSGDSFLQSMAASLAWWKAREMGEGFKQHIDLTRLVDIYRTYLVLFRGMGVGQENEKDAGEDSEEMVKSVLPIPPSPP
jgi:hypothetical protein